MAVLVVCGSGLHRNVGGGLIHLLLVVALVVFVLNLLSDDDGDLEPGACGMLSLRCNTNGGGTPLSAGSSVIWKQSGEVAGITSSISFQETGRCRLLECLATNSAQVKRLCGPCS